MTTVLSQNIFLISCGSFNPVTYMHLRMFELARDHLRSLNKKVNVVKGYLSPVSDAYGKQGLLSSTHRLEMLKRATLTSDWIDVLPWECEQNGWTPTAKVLDQYYESLNCAEKNIRLLLLCGADVLESFSVKGLWKEADIKSIIQKHGLIVISRPQFHPQQYIESSDLLKSLKSQIYVAHEWNENDLSSTKIRRAIREGNSIKYLVVDSVLEYIKKQQLYTEKPDDNQIPLAPLAGNDD